MYFSSCLWNTIGPKRAKSQQIKVRWWILILLQESDAKSKITNMVKKPKTMNIVKKYKRTMKGVKSIITILDKKGPCSDIVYDWCEVK